MSAEWKVLGQIGTVTKSGNFYIVNIADNRYRNGKKVSTVWLNCMCRFKPLIKSGDTVIACGTFEESKNAKFQFALIIDHIGVIGKEDAELVDGIGEI